jgi:hypothetical protein
LNIIFQVEVKTQKDRKRKAEHQEAWDESRDVRVGSWRSFQGGKNGKKAKKPRVQKEQSAAAKAKDPASSTERETNPATAIASATLSLAAAKLLLRRLLANKKRKDVVSPVENATTVVVNVVGLLEVALTDFTK